MTPSASSSVSRSRPRVGAPLVLLDANVLLRASGPGFPWRAEAERLLGPVRVAVPRSVLNELGRLVERGVAGARLAAELAATLPPLAGPGRGDDAILALAIRERAVVLTADRGLTQRLHSAGLDVLVPRDRSRLELRRAPKGASSAASVRVTVKKRPRLRRPVRRGTLRNARR